jgi:predicted phage terminase large subunit-like protein
MTGKSLSKLELYQTLQRYKQNERERRVRQARTNLLDFTRFTMPEYRVNWHHRLICQKLDEFIEGKNKRLIIACPPRHGKSELVSRRFPAYILGRNPDAKIIACSYGSDLASLLNRDVQRIISSPEYAELFPDTKLNDANVRSTAQENYLRNSDIFEVVNHKGVYRSAGVGGAITGMGGDYLIVDDPIRSRADAESPAIRDKVWKWYSSTFRTRRQKDASILITATRWHEDDLTGRLLELAKNNPDADQWEVINLPALSEEPLEEYDQRTGPGQALWPDEFPEVDLLSTKASSTVYEWLSLYQQRPSAAAGNLVKKEHFKYCTLENGVLSLSENKKFMLSQCKVFQTCDPAASEKASADDFVLATWAQTPQNDLALIDILKTRMETPVQVPLFRQQYTKWRPLQQWVETNGLGISLYQHLIAEGLPIGKLNAGKADKLTRFIPAATRITAGAVYFLAGAPWLNDYEAELLGFPNVKQDGQVDVTSYACQVVIEHPFVEMSYETSYIGTSYSSGSMRI